MQVLPVKIKDEKKIAQERINALKWGTSAEHS